MSTRTIVARIINLLIMGSTTIYFGLWIWVINVWPINDDQLESMTTLSWLKSALLSFTVSMVLISLFNLFMYWINSYLYSKITDEGRKKFPKIVSVIAFSSLVLVAFVGGVQFFIDKPYM